MAVTLKKPEQTDLSTPSHSESDAVKQNDPAPKLSASRGTADDDETKIEFNSD